MARPSSGLFETHGLPPELTVEELRAHGMDVRDWHDGFDRARREHQDRSRAGSRRKFAGGLADSGAERVVRMHTAAASGSSASSRPARRAADQGRR